MCAVHLVLGQASDGGIRNICWLLELCQLDRFVASSYCAQHSVAANIEKAIEQFGQEERDRLAKEMPHREITLCEDETFHPQICLVAIEPVGIGQDYHPFDLKTGAPVESAQAQEKLNSHFDTLEQVASEAGLKSASIARLAKAKRVLPSMIETEVLHLEEQARSAAELFQRSSSCVEGRNGQLSLRHHGLREIRARKLRVLGVLHNFVIKRGDGSTAASRFFGQEHRALFPWLVENMPLPSRPRKRRKAS